MQETLILLLPVAAASAVSPLLLTASIISLSSPKKALVKAFAMAAGCLVTLIPVAVFILFFDNQVASVQTSSSATGRDVLHMVVGLGLVVLIIYDYTKRTKKPKQQKLLNADKGAGKYFLAGLGLMAANFTTLMMYVPAAAIINKSGGDIFVKIAGLIEMVIFSMLPVIIGPALVLIMGKRADLVLKPLSGFMAKYGSDLISVIFGILGVYLFIEGLLPFVK